MMFRMFASRDHRAAIAPMAVFLMMFLAGMLAFSIDIGYICSVQAELQDAADAAALAGAQQLEGLFISYYSPGQTQQQQVYLTATTDITNPASPIPTAQRFAAYNKAGGVYIQLPAADISFSYYDGTTFSSPSYANNLFPNTVNVTTRRDTVANGPLGLFFGQLFGIPTINLNASASATIYTANYSTFSTGNSASSSSIQRPAPMIPVGLDVKMYADFASGNFTFTNGNFSSNSPYLSSSNVTIGPNGLPQLQVYPTPTNTPGSFGLIDIGVPSNNTPAFRNWIDDGQTPNDINYLLSNNLLPVSPSTPQPWKVGPGLKSTLLSNFQSILGIPSLIPLFQPVSLPPNYVAASGSGQNATYAVVGFAGVTISQAEGSGSSMNISIQLSATNDPCAVGSSVAPAQGPSVQSSSISSVTGTNVVQTTFVSPKLTQ